MKNNNFADEYESIKALQKVYNGAEAENDTYGMAATRELMKYLQDSIEEKGSNYEWIFEKYRDAREHGNEYIDLHNEIWDINVPRLIACLRECGIEKFTFSCTCQNAVRTAWLFTENGCSLEGMIQIHGTGPENMIPAYVFSVQQA